MTRLVFGLCMLLTTLALSACGGGRSGSAATMPDGSRIAIMVHLDPGITPDMPPDRVAQMNQMASWMEDDLLSILDKSGYAAGRVADPATPPGPGRYMLQVKVKNYNAGSKAARMWVGFGAGAATLDTHFDLLADGGGAVIGGDPSVGSGRDWKNAARKVNLQTVDTVNAALKRR